MKFVAIAAAASVAALGFAGQAVAKENEVKIEDAVARVVVRVEDRADVAVEVVHGSSSLPRLTQRVEGNRIVLDGQLGRAMGRSDIRQCHSAAAISDTPGEGAWAEVKDVGRVQLSDAPLVLVRVPRGQAVDISVGGAVFGAIGRGASSVELSNAGCGDWAVANTEGSVSLSLAGSGDAAIGNSRSLEVSVAGAGDVTAGATGAADLSIAGAGSVTIQSVNGPVDASIAGAGDLTIRGGRSPKLDISITGAGDVDFQGEAGDVDASIVGAGDIRLARVTGNIDRSILGAGDITVGR